MVNSSRSQEGKSQDKIPAAKLTITKFAEEIKKSPVSPTSPVSLQDEVLALRAKNKILTDTITAMKKAATEHEKKHHELVWYARMRNRYPTHEARKRIEQSEEHMKEISKLFTPDGDYHHGFHTGVLAASRLFKEQADILDVNEHEELNHDLMLKAVKHSDRIEKSNDAFPQVNVDEVPAVE